MTKTLTASPRVRRLVLALGGLALLGGLWSGLVRLGWAIPPILPTAVVAHGPLMVGGFLGTLVGLERAVALGRPWAFAAPALAGLGGLATIAALPTPPIAGLFTASSLVLVAVFVRFFRLRPDRSGALLVGGAAAWWAGNGLWLVGQPLPWVVPWWAAFLVFTIAGERLELARLRLRPRAEGALLLASLPVPVGLLISVLALEPGLRLAGLGLLAIAVWGGVYDLARRTVRRPGLPRFAAICLLLGYFWLGLAGLLWLLGPGSVGGWYDAMLHSLFLGFGFSMIFGHAPTIIPAVAGISVPFRARFYLHVWLLHGSLLVRVAADLAGWAEARRWGGLLNVAAILLFALMTAAAARAPARPAGVRGPG